MRGFEISTIHGGSFNYHMKMGFLQIHLVFHLTAVLAPYLLWQPKNLYLLIHMFCSKTTLRSFLLKVFLMVCVCVCVCISIAILTPFRLFSYMIFHTKIFATNWSQICVFSENLIKYISSLKNCNTTYKKRNKNFFKKSVL